MTKLTETYTVTTEMIDKGVSRGGQQLISLRYGAPREELNKKRANLLALKRMLANIVHHVPYSRI